MKKTLNIIFLTLVLTLLTVFTIIVIGTTNQQGTVDTSNSTHLWLMDDCAGSFPAELPANYSNHFLAENFDVFVVGGGVAVSRLPYILDHIANITLINPDAKFTYYSNFNQLQSFTNNTLNNEENAFAHSTDPASMVLIPQSTKVIVDWQPDSRGNYTDFSVGGYKVYQGKSLGAMSLAVTTNLTQFVNEGLDNEQEYYYQIYTVSNNQMYNYSFSELTTPTASPQGFYLIDGGAKITAMNLADQIYNITFFVNASEEGDSARVYIDLANDWWYAPTEKFNMTWRNGRFEYNLSVDLDDYRGYIQPNVEYGFPYFFEVVNHSSTYYLPANGEAVDDVYSTTANNRAKHRIYGEWGMRINSTHWQDWFVNYASDKMSRENLDGIYIDEPQINVLLFWDVRPVDVTQATANASVQTLARRLNNTYPDKLIFYNSLDTVNLNEFGLDGGLLEGWGTISGTYNTNTWLDHLNRTIQSENQSLSFVLPTDIVDARQRQFLLASYYLVKGNGTYYWHEGWDCPTNSTLETELLNSTVDMGMAIDSYPNTITSLKLSDSNLYLRNYTHGFVIVNPTTSNYNFNLSDRLFDELNVTSGGFEYNVTGQLTVTANTGRLFTYAYVPASTPAVPDSPSGGGGGGSPVFSPLFKGSTPINVTNLTIQPTKKDYNLTNIGTLFYEKLKLWSKQDTEFYVFTGILVFIMVGLIYYVWSLAKPKKG